VNGSNSRKWKWKCVCGAWLGIVGHGGTLTDCVTAETPTSIGILCCSDHHRTMDDLVTKLWRTTKAPSYGLSRDRKCTACVSIPTGRYKNPRYLRMARTNLTKRQCCAGSFGKAVRSNEVSGTVADGVPREQLQLNAEKWRTHMRAFPGQLRRAARLAALCVGVVLVAGVASARLAPVAGASDVHQNTTTSLARVAAADASRSISSTHRKALVAPDTNTVTCLFDGQSDQTIIENVTPGSSITMTCTGFQPSEQVLPQKEVLCSSKRIPTTIWIPTVRRSCPTVQAT